MRWRAAVLGVVVAGCASPPRSRPPAPAAAARPVVDAAPAPRFGEFPEAGPFRLPHTFEPRGYRVRIAPGDTRFTGHIEIDGTLSEATSLIWLHGVDLVVTKATASKDGATVPLELSAPRTDQLLGFRAPAPLEPGAWTLTIDYSGRIREVEPPQQMPWGKQDAPAVGLFRRVFEGQPYLFTQGEAIYARMIFPCIDEPDRKVPWQVTLDVPKQMVVAGNAPIQRVTDLDAGHKRVELAPTQPLPSYLVAFAVGPFDVFDAGTSKSGVPIRVLGLHGPAATAWVATQIAPRQLDRIEDWLGVPYPYSKLDLVEVPKAGWGAMENPGLITIDRQSIASSQIIAHELAHLWFGDLVTLRWWDDIWLNESFATFIPDAIVHDDPLEQRAEAMAITERLWPVRLGAASNRDLVFGQFAPYESIQKGAGVLRLLELYVGPEKFRQALTSYLKAHAHGSVSTDDLIAALESSTKQSVRPVLEAMLAGSIGPLELETSCRRVHFRTFTSMPVCLAYDRDGKRDQVCATIDDKHPDVSLPAKACPRWVMPNAGGLEPYRVAWTPAIVHALVTRAWPVLTAGEKQVLFDEVDDAAARLEVFAAGAGDARPLTGQERYLASLMKYVPGDLRGSFDAFVEDRYGSKARETHFRQATWRQETEALVDLVARTGDAELSSDAAQFAPTYERLDGNTPYYSVLVQLRATADPAFLAAALDAIANQSDRRYLTLGALAEVPGILRALVADPARTAKLDIFDLRHLIEQSCDPADRPLLVQLVDDHPKLKAALTTFDQCLATQKTIEPLLRRWLASQKLSTAPRSGAAPR